MLSQRLRRCWTNTGLEELKTVPRLFHSFELPSQGREPRPAPSLTVETETPLAYKPFTELAHLFSTRQIFPVELADLYPQRIEQVDGDLKSYITVLAETARQEARERALAEGSDLGPLQGIHEDRHIS